jgi:hypothetical protein
MTILRQTFDSGRHHQVLEGFELEPRGDQRADQTGWKSIGKQSGPFRSKFVENAGRNEVARCLSQPETKPAFQISKKKNTSLTKYYISLAKNVGGV